MWPLSPSFFNRLRGKGKEEGVALLRKILRGEGRIARKPERKGTLVHFIVFLIPQGDVGNVSK